MPSDIDKMCILFPQISLYLAGDFLTRDLALCFQLIHDKVAWETLQYYVISAVLLI